MRIDEVQEKMRAEQAYNDMKQCAEPITQGIMGQESGLNPYRRPTLREEAEKQLGFHREQADKHDRAVAFLRENPAFDEFVRLVREGAIQF